MTVQTTTLANGIRVVTHEMDHLASAALGVWVRAGSRSERENEHGIAHLLEHMAFKGTLTRSAMQVAEEIENVGGELNAATSVEMTSYYARVLAEDIALAIDIVSDILKNSVFDAEELAREQHVILQELGASLDSPDERVFDIMQEIAFPDQSLGRTILGTEESVAGFDGDAIRHYLHDHYRGPEIVVSAGGAIRHADFTEEVARHFGSISAEPAPTWSKAHYKGGYHIEQRDLKEVQICLGFRGYSYRDDDFYAAQILTSVLGGGMSSRLFQEVREKRGLCYSIYSFHWGFDETGLFGIHAATQPDDVEALMDVLMDVLMHAMEDFQEQEVERAKAQLRAGMLMSLESPAARAGQIARQSLVFGRTLDIHEITNKINAVRVEDICRIGKEIVFGSMPTLAAVGAIDESMLPRDLAECYATSRSLTAP